MKRHSIDPRPDAHEAVEKLGLSWHGEGSYWNESAYYEFTGEQVDELEAATNELHSCCLQAVQYVIDENRFSELGIPEPAVPEIVRSWDAEPPSVYGRFDLAYDGVNPPKMLEYNADTPTALLEASVIQYDWLQARFAEADQFNSIHEQLLALWAELQPYLNGTLVHFTSLDSWEDEATVTYLADTAMQAGVQSVFIPIDEIGYQSTDGRFVDASGGPITTIFKLYPWENLWREEFYQYIPTAHALWIEPAWKAVLSNKAILAILHELFPGHPNLLPAYLGNSSNLKGGYVRKPVYGREGANVRLVGEGGEILSQTEGPYAGPHVYQQLFPLPQFHGVYPVIGSWIIGQEAAGVGIREAEQMITGNTSRFVPHLFWP